MKNIVIVGAGFSGICAAIELKRVGIHDFVILESSQAVGGTWSANTYPGAACDVPSHLYSLARAPWPGWSHRYARQPEILAYLEQVVLDFGLTPHLRLGVRVEEARWDGVWRLTTSDGAMDAGFLLLGIGALRDPRWPDIPGLDNFRGTVVHSSRWPEDLDLQGRSVAVVGTGASAIQVVPAIVDQVSRLTVFQRTAPWIRPRLDAPISDRRKALYTRLPWLQKAHRAAIRARLEAYHPFVFGPLHRQLTVIDRLLAREVRAAAGKVADRAVPPYRLGCKRILVSDGWFPALNRDHVHLQTAPITRIVPEGLMVDGTVVPADVLICCTGYQVSDPLGPLRIVGRDGVDLREVWAERPHAHLGISVPGFPNLFALLGPNTALGHNSVVLMIEAAMVHVLQLIQHAKAENVDVEPTIQATQAWLDDLDARHARSVWSSGCDSWYLAEGRENFTLWPGSTWEYARRVRRFHAADYKLSTSKGSSAIA